MLYGNSHSTVHFILGEDEDTAGATFQTTLEFIPRVGDSVEIVSQRDGKGNYMNEGAASHERPKSRDVLKGKVSRVEHIIEERGRNSRECHTVQFVQIFVKK
jgi:hypothetical protein